MELLFLVVLFSLRLLFTRLKRRHRLFMRMFPSHELYSKWHSRELKMVAITLYAHFQKTYSIISRFSVRLQFKRLEMPRIGIESYFHSWQRNKTYLCFCNFTRTFYFRFYSILLKMFYLSLVFIYFFFVRQTYYNSYIKKVNFTCPDNPWV